MLIKTAFVFDESGNMSPEDEANLAVDELTSFGIDVSVSGIGSTMMDIYRDSFDLLIIDYGGLSTMGGSHAEMQVWSACNYAENHPGSLVVLWSKYTERVYRGELAETFGHLGNVLLRFEQHESAYDFSEDSSRRFKERIQAWFEVTGLTLLPPDRRGVAGQNETPTIHHSPERPPEVRARIRRQRLAARNTAKAPLFAEMFTAEDIAAKPDYYVHGLSDRDADREAVIAEEHKLYERMISEHGRFIMVGANASETAEGDT